MQKFDVVFETVDPASELAVAAISRYFDELRSRFDEGFDAGVGTDADSYRFPKGIFVVARKSGDRKSSDGIAGCGALQRFDDSTAEVKRMWINPDFRGAGVGRRLLTHLEGQASQLGNSRIVLDTHASLHEAIALYERSGYQQVERYNDNPYAQRWFAKSLLGEDQLDQDRLG